MKRRALVLLIALVVVGVAVPGGWPSLPPTAGLPAEVADGGSPAAVAASGFVEAQEVQVASDLGGRILSLGADEGDEVAAGQPLVRLDDSLLRAQIDQARADVAVAEAALARVQAGVRPETLAWAQAVLSQAQAGQAAALVAWQDAQGMVEDPQQLDLAITALRSQLRVMDLQQQQAQALADSAQAARDLADEAVRLLEDFEPETIEIGPYRFRVKLPPDALPQALQEQAAATYQSWSSWTAVAQAQVARRGLESRLAELLRQKANPLDLQAQAHAAESQHELAAAAVGLAQAQLDGLRLGATAEQVEAARSQVEIARAALHALEVQLDRSLVSAPISGLVLDRPVHVGELAVPGAPLLTLADLDRLSLTVYVPQDELGRVQVGQPVSVTVDAYPDRVFPGSVRSIAAEAEFLPKSIQTREDRMSMVFAVEVDLPNPDHALKPGMPADALLPLPGGAER